MINSAGLNQTTRSMYFTGFVVVIAGIIWSFGAVIVRYMVDGDQYKMQYLTYRGLATASVLLVFLIVKHGVRFYRFFFQIGVPGLLGATALALAMISFIHSITITSVSVTLFMLATMSFMAAIFGYILLKEVIGRHSCIAIIYYVSV